VYYSTLFRILFSFACYLPYLSLSLIYSSFRMSFYLHTPKHLAEARSLCGRFDSRPQFRTFLLRSLVIFLSPSRQILDVFFELSHYRSIIVAARSKAWIAFARSKTGILGSNPTRGMGVCVRLSCICVAPRVGSGLAMADSPSKESYLLCID
jgi:hypothetical protein